MKKTVFTGSGVAIITPFNENGIDFESFGKLVDFHLENSTDAIIVCGTTGEAATMPDNEHLSAIEFVVKRVNKRIPVIAGTGSNDTVHGVKLSKEAERLGADALLVVTPYYNKANKQGLVNHFKMIADSVQIPVILYNVPSRTGMNIALDVLEELKDIDNIVGIKEASGNMSYVMELAAKFADRFDIYSGNDDIIVPVMSVGGKGVISVLANVLPKETHDICQLYLDGKCEESRKLQLKLLDLINSLFCEVNPIPVKTAINLMGLNGGILRMPLYEMAPNNKERLIKDLKAAGVKLQ
ncbi:MAG: 4-hydroxy-tetrahydrodipicolinate synthase [Ruminococcaceae bacterium]|nr:4-hydroxy-tetrahydrodipicolinate synthase [Oscillospiraceae bacterium]